MTEKIILQDGGIRISAVLEKESAGACPLVIHLHGFSSSKDRPHNIACCRAMREAGCATLRMDMYGHGETDGEFRDHTLFKWISNALAAVDWARRQPFVTSILLAGHSQGGLVAALAGAMERDRVKGLILRAPAFLIPECARTGQMLGRSFDPGVIPDEIPLFKGLTLSGNYVRVAQTIHPEEAMVLFPGPVLLIHGDQDDTVPWTDSQAAARRYRDCRLAVIPGETHHFDRCLEKTQAVIRDWLGQRIGPIIP